MAQGERVLPNLTLWLLFSDELLFHFLSPRTLKSHPRGKEPSCFLLLPCRVLTQFLIRLGLRQGVSLLGRAVPRPDHVPGCVC